MILTLLGGAIFLAAVWLSLAVRASTAGMRYTAFAYDLPVRSQMEDQAAPGVACSGQPRREAA